MKKSFLFLLGISALSMYSKAFADEFNDKTFLKLKPHSVTSAKVVGVDVSFINNTSTYVDFAWNGVTMGDENVAGHSSYVGKISAQPGTLYSIHLTSASPFYYTDGIGHSGGPTKSAFYSVTLNNGYTVTVNP